MTPSAAALLRDDARGARAVVLFLLLTFGLSWAWLGPLAIRDVVVEPGVGWPTHLPALLGPAIGGLVAIAYRDGREGVRGLSARAPSSGCWAISPNRSC